MLFLKKPVHPHLSEKCIKNLLVCVTSQGVHEWEHEEAAHEI